MINVYADLRWPEHSGIGVVKNELLKRLPAHLSVTDAQVAGGIGSPLSPVRVSSALKKFRGQGGVYWSAGFVPQALRYFPSVITVHDLTHMHFYSAKHRHYYNLILKPLYRKCEAILCGSEYSRQEFLEWSGISPEKVHMAYHGVADKFAGSAGAKPYHHEYIFYPGNQRAYKNLERLIAAYAASRLPGMDIKLVCTGQENAELRALAKSFDVSDSLIFTGRVSDEILVSLYKHANTVVFVSLYEGFGLPILEAMACGVPVITSNVASMPEVAGDAAVVVDPYSVEAIADAMNRSYGDTDLRSELVRKGHLRVKEFSWDRAARSVWGLVDRIGREYAR